MEPSGILFGAFQRIFQAAKIGNSSFAITKNQNINSSCPKIRSASKFKSFVSLTGNLTDNLDGKYFFLGKNWTENVKIQWEYKTPTLKMQPNVTRLQISSIDSNYFNFDLYYRNFSISFLSKIF